MKVLHVTSSLHVGGAERLLYDLASAQHKRGDSVEVVTMTNGGPFSAALSAAGVRVHHFETRTGPMRSRLSELVRCVRFIRTHASDVTNSWMYHASVLTAIARRDRRHVALGIHHEDPSDPALGKTRMIARLAGFAARFVGGTIYVSESAKRSHTASGWPADRSYVVNGGVNTDRFAPLTSDQRSALRREIDSESQSADCVVIYVGRNHPDKHPELVARAFATAVKTRESLRLWMVGHEIDDDNTALRDILSDPHVRVRSKLLGPIPDIAPIMGAADVIAVSSRTESFGLALIEGMLCGLSPVSTAVGIAPMLVDSNRLVHSDDPDDFAKRILAAADNCTPDQHRKAALRFGTTEMTDQYHACYEDILGTWPMSSKGRRPYRRRRQSRLGP